MTLEHFKELLKNNNAIRLNNLLGIRTKSFSLELLEGNKHNPNSPARYYYLEHPITIDGQNYLVNIDIRKVPNYTGRFHIHSIKTKKVATSGKSKTSQSTVTTNVSIPPSNQSVNNVQHSLSGVQYGKFDVSYNLIR